MSEITQFHQNKLSGDLKNGLPDDSYVSVFRQMKRLSAHWAR
jgi:hypothetical protein